MVTEQKLNLTNFSQKSSSTHFSLCQELFKKGKSIFIEKSIAETAVEAAQLAALAAERELVLQVGHIFHFDPATDFIKKYLHSGEMGAIQSLNGIFSGFKRPRADAQAGVDCMKVVEAAMRSHAAGQEMRL